MEKNCREKRLVSLRSQSTTVYRMQLSYKIYSFRSGFDYLSQFLKFSKKASKFFEKKIFESLFKPLIKQLRQNQKLPYQVKENDIIWPDAKKVSPFFTLVFNAF